LSVLGQLGRSPAECSTSGKVGLSARAPARRTGELEELIEEREDSRESGESSTSEQLLSADDDYLTLALSESIYDEAFLVPLIHGKEADDLFGRRFVSWLMLTMNLLMQMAVMTKITQLVIANDATRSSALWFDEGGACNRISKIEPQFKRLPDIHSSYYDCHPAEVKIVSTWSKIDTNADGLWSRDEAVAQELQYKAETGHDLEIAFVWDSLAKKFNAAATGVLQEAVVAPGMDEMRLCELLDAAICPNAEIRGFLKNHVAYLDPQRRIDRCEQVLNNECAGIFGEKFVQYQLAHASLCGDRNTIWEQYFRVRTVKYEIEEKYNRPIGGVTTGTYFGFLCVILAIWHISMMQELRNLKGWYEMMWYFPSCDAMHTADGGNQCTEVSETSIVVLQIPVRHKFATLVVHLIPRTIFLLICSTIGSKFLLQADDYEDLILNCVALSFLIEVDELIFSGLMSKLRKTWVSITEPLRVKMPGKRNQCCTQIRKLRNSSVFTMLIIVATTSIAVSTSYFKVGGKLDRGVALGCLCQVHGSQCASAQFFGGFESVQAALLNTSMGIANGGAYAQSTNSDGKSDSKGGKAGRR